jgi:hypothetical protein
MAVTLSITVLRDVMSCGLIYSYQSHGGPIFMSEE